MKFVIIDDGDVIDDTYTDLDGAVEKAKQLAEDTPGMPFTVAQVLKTVEATVNVEVKDQE